MKFLMKYVNNSFEMIDVISIFSKGWTATILAKEQIHYCEFLPTVDQFSYQEALLLVFMVIETLTPKN